MLSNSTSRVSNSMAQHLPIPAYNSHGKMCTLLIENGAEVDKETTKDYFTALMHATLAGCTMYTNFIWCCCKISKNYLCSVVLDCNFYT